MKIRTILLHSFIFLLLTLLSCNSKDSSTNDDSQHSDSLQKHDYIPKTIDLKYAQGFSVETFENYYRVHIHNPWDKGRDLAVYILAYPLQYHKQNLKENELLIDLPIKRVAIMSVSNIGYFDLLNRLGAIAALADGQRLYNPDLRSAVELGSVKVLGNSASINKEELLLADCDIFIQTAYEASSGKDKSMIEAGIKVVYNIDWMEETPLARAEWIKFIGLLMGENDVADSVFKQIEQNYIALKTKAELFDYKPDVLLGGLYKDVWYMPGGRSYKAHLLKDAGTNYRWATDSTKGSLALSFETVLEQQIDAPVWVEVPFTTKKQLLVSDERYAFFDAFKIGTLYHNLKRSNATGGNDYWERGHCRPDELLEDLMRIFHREDMEEGELKYYGRVTK